MDNNFKIEMNLNVGSFSISGSGGFIDKHFNKKWLLIINIK